MGAAPEPRANAATAASGRARQADSGFHIGLDDFFWDFDVFLWADLLVVAP
jgi:hypothetical protein